MWQLYLYAFRCWADVIEKRWSFNTADYCPVPLSQNNDEPWQLLIPSVKTIPQHIPQKPNIEWSKVIVYDV